MYCKQGFIKESIGLSTMSLVTLFATLALTRRSYLNIAFFYVLAFMVRPNFVLFFLPLSLLRFFFGHERLNGRRLFLYILPLLISLPWIIFVDSFYPGSGLNYIFVSKWMGFDFAADYFPSYFISLGYNSASIFEWESSFSDTFRALLNPQVLNFTLTIWGLKLLSVLGLRFQEAFVTSMGGYFSEIWGSIYFYIISIPAFFSGALSCFRLFTFRINFSDVLVISSVIYLVLTALFIGVPRFGLLVAPFLVPNFLRFIMIMPLQRLVIKGFLDFLAAFCFC